MWLNELYQRWTGRTQNNRQARRAAARRWKHLTVEPLEDRTLLSAPDPFTVSGMSEQGASQFHGVASKHGSAYAGATFSTSGSVGGISANVGGQVSLSISGQLGLSANYYLTPGTVNATYGQFTLNQNQEVEPTSFGQKVNFTPQNTYVNYSTGSLTTVSPTVAAGVNLVANLSGTVSGKVGYLFGTSSSKTSFKTGNINQPLGAYNSNGSLTIDGYPPGLSIFGFPIAELFGANGQIDGVSYTDQTGLNYSAFSLTFQVEIVPGVYVDVTVGPNSTFTGLNEGLALSAGLPTLDSGEVGNGVVGEGQGPNSPPPGGSVSVSLGSANQTLPSINLSSDTLTPITNASGTTIPGSLQATGGSTFASLTAQMGPLAAAILPPPFDVVALGASSDSISLGPLSATLTPASFQLTNGLTFEQTGTVAPQNTLTYNFSNAATGKAMKVDVTETVPNQQSGQPPVTTDLGKVSSVSFTPGVDSIGVEFDGTPIEVKPVWSYGMQYTNEIDLDYTLTGALTVGQLSATVSAGPISHTENLGPLIPNNSDSGVYSIVQQPLGSPIYDESFPIGSTTFVNLPSFVIGDTFTPSLKVKTTADNNTPYNSSIAGSGSLRAAIESANLNYQTGNHKTQTITLGPGTYNLTLPATGKDGALDGDLNVASNLIIQGAGIGQTIINASGLGDRLFHIQSGSNVTLEGVTLENGSAIGYGGAVYNTGTMTINNSELEGNSVTGSGGAIYNKGRLMIENSTLTGNSATEGGGAIDNDGNLTLTNSTLSDNSASAYGGGVFNSDIATIANSTLSGNSAVQDGGGVFNSGTFHKGTLTVINSTITQNTASTQNTENGFGGGIYNGGTATITDSTFMSNGVPYGTGGGGIFNSGTLALNNSTLYGNKSFQAGGGLYESSKGTAALINDTLTQNLANSQGLSQYTLGGGIYVAGGGAPPRLANTLVAQNYNNGTNANGTPYYADDIDGSVDTVSSLNNLIGTGGSGGLTNGQNGNLVGIANPGLGTISTYGGPTMTVPLLKGSPAIDAGNNAEFVSATDQRGFARVVNGGKATAVNAVDIGAFEYGAVKAGVDLALTGSVSSNTVVPGGQITYTLTLTNNGSKNQSDMTLFDTLPANTTLVSWTPPSGWQGGLGLPYGYTNDTVYAWSNNHVLEAGKSVTFTLVLQVNGGTPSGTILRNTASVGPVTGDPKPGNNSITLTARVGLKNVTRDFSISLQSINTDQQTGEMFTTVGIGDTSSGTLNGPLALVITGLPADVTMVNATGTYQGDPYYEFVPIGSTATDHQSFNPELFFTYTTKNPTTPLTTFGTKVLQGL